ncbi:gluconokinase [Anabaena sp. UHCC 0399]|uniref:gluconokinase n=1 Tax=Anabaena sp. UHCC 0399 TaxID=3110238 RepID=UPI002B1ED51D|nr:gluconokinase [Anabaena sp. UHCC 0399]MEA5567205.1 gluconokinase [Anabaena sp. UHCC 0399]
MIVIIMGVSGSGKTTIGKLLAESLGWEFQDADDFHSSANIEKMRLGIPLDDADRIPWLQDIRNAIAQWLQENRNVVLACSALKASYRQFLVGDSSDIKIVYLKGADKIIQKRLQERQSHFMSEKLLNSQFNTIEEPNNAIYIDISQPPEEIVNFLKTTFG